MLFFLRSDFNFFVIFYILTNFFIPAKGLMSFLKEKYQEKKEKSNSRSILWSILFELQS